MFGRLVIPLAPVVVALALMMSVTSLIKSSPIQFPSEETLLLRREMAQRVLNNLNLSVDPCKNFYQFSCGGWLADQGTEMHVRSRHNMETWLILL